MITDNDYPRPATYVESYVIAEFIQLKIWTSCEGFEVVTISEIYSLGYFQVKYYINNITEAFFMIEVLT